MKLKYLALTASLCAAFFAACDDSGVAPKEHIAAYDTLPRFCEESDTVRLSSTGNLFYCNNGDWLEVGVIINKPKSSSSADKPKSSDDTEIESSDDENIVESAESGKSSSSRGRGKSSNSSGTNSVSSGEGTESNSSTEDSGSSGTESSDESSSSEAPNRDEYFADLDEFVNWNAQNGPKLKENITTNDLKLKLSTLGYKKFDLSFMGGDNYEHILGSKIPLSKQLDLYYSHSIYYKMELVEDPASTNEETPACDNVEDPACANVEDPGIKYVTHYVAGPVDGGESGHDLEAGTYNGNIELLASAVLAPYSGTGDIWWPTSITKAYRAITPLDNGTGTAGWWYDGNDNDDGGNSTIVWPAKRGNDYDAYAFDNIIDYCGGICGTAILDQGTLYYSPFVMLGFDVVGRNTSGALQDGDATKGDFADGICVTYTSDASIALEIGLGIDGDAAIGAANPQVNLTKSTAPNTLKFKWADFEQPSWAKETISGEEAAAKMVNLRFRIQSRDGAYDFNIMEIGTYNGCE